MYSLKKVCVLVPVQAREFESRRWKDFEGIPEGGKSKQKLGVFSEANIERETGWTLEGPLRA